MPAHAASPELRRAIAREFLRLGNISAVASMLDVAPNTVRKCLVLEGLDPVKDAFNLGKPRHRITGLRPANFDAKPEVKPEPKVEPQPDEPAPQLERNWKEKGDDATLNFVSDVLIRTAEDAMKYGEVDTSVWYVDSMEVTAWQVGMKLKRFEDGKQVDKSEKVQLWRIALRLKRILPKPWLAATEALFDRMKTVAPRFESARRLRPKSPYMMLLDLCDVHISKLAWARECGEDSDLKASETVFLEAFEDGLEEAVGRDVEEIVVPVGNDFFHIDGITNATTAGTVVDTDGRYHKIIEVGESGFVSCVERARQIASVRILHVPGNHDRIASWHLCRYLQAYFHNCRDVSFDIEPRPRKFVTYGKHYLGLTHGNEEKPATLPLTLATENPELWAASEFREFLMGHEHRKSATTTPNMRTVDGVRLRWLNALSSMDSWTYRKAYYGGKRAAEVFLYARDSGRITNIEVPIRRAS